MLERIDKVIASQTNYSRSDIKKLITKRKIIVNNNIVLKSDFKIDPIKDDILIDGNKLLFKEYVYLVLNKPKGYVSATEDKKDKTVIELVPEQFRNRELFPAGRLDKDTTGLMIITDDGEFAHNILSPRKHISKQYEVEIDIPVTKQMAEGFEKGVNLNDGECKTAKLEITGKYTAIVTLTEGRYHQIKRMFGCFGAKVVNLNRISMGKFKLPKDLKLGDCRELKNEEKNLIEKR